MKKLSKSQKEYKTFLNRILKIGLEAIEKGVVFNSGEEQTAHAIAMMHNGVNTEKAARAIAMEYTEIEDALSTSSEIEEEDNEVVAWLVPYGRKG